MAHVSQHGRVFPLSSIDFLLTCSSSFVDRDFIIVGSRLLAEPRILVEEYDEEGISNW
jgi:hypothetical protein